MEKLIGYKEASKYLGLEIKELYRLVREKNIPYRRISERRVKFAKSELFEWSEKSKEGN